VVSTASQLLAASVLQAFPNSAATGTTAEDQHDASPGTLRRAIAFIEASPDTDIGISDIARAACVTPRAVQLAFRRRLRVVAWRHPVPLNLLCSLTRR
jgi:transcriptional regulator GlxA family with amidase domain